MNKQIAIEDVIEAIDGLQDKLRTENSKWGPDVMGGIGLLEWLRADLLRLKDNEYVHCKDKNCRACNVFEKYSVKQIEIQNNSFEQFKKTFWFITLAISVLFMIIIVVFGIVSWYFALKSIM